MTYEEFEQLISHSRLTRYIAACDNDKRRTLKLYRANIRLSGDLLAILGMFEVVLRNKIDVHYKAQFFAAPGSHDWLLAATLPGGFLTGRNCYNSRIKINEAYRELGTRYTHDRLVASLSFGFWKHLFKGFQFMAGGSTLLSIFPGKPPRTNQSNVYAKLDRINAIRNRVAHHEPICFGLGNAISSAYVRSHFQEIIDLLNWMNIDESLLFTGIDGVLKEAGFIDRI